MSVMEKAEQFDADATDVCPVCHAADNPLYRTAIVHRHYDIPGSYETRRCGRCELEWVSPSVSEAEIASFYPEDYYAHVGGTRASLWSRLVKLLGVDVRSKEPTFASPGKMLDIGCGTGAALDRYAKEGWEAVGVNFSGNPIDERYKVLIGDFSKMDFGDERFDYVRMNHTLEHLADPRATIAKIAAITRPGSTVFIAVPNGRSWAYRLFGQYWWNYGVPCHLFLFGKKSLQTLLHDHGFAITKVREVSDFASVTGSIQIWLNRHNGRPSNRGFLFQSKFLRMLAHTAAKGIDRFTNGDCIEVTAVRHGMGK